MARNYKTIRVSEQGYRSSKVSAYRRRAVYEAAEFRCQICGKQFPDAGRAAPSLPYSDERGREKVCILEVDHIVPVHLGGTNAPENLQALCTQCNSRKGHKRP